jgi:hypothetical protein|eukprot:COSAG06_NODE_1907_length_8089_cov_27.903254_3_plen_43_part_00
MAGLAALAQLEAGQMTEELTEEIAKLQRQKVGEIDEKPVVHT